MPTYSLDSNIRKKGYKISYDVTNVQYSEPVSSIPTLTNSSTKETASIISKKPMLISKAELKNTDINLVGINPLEGLIANSNKTFCSKLLNYVEPYDIGGTIKTLFYTSVNTELKVGDRVFIINGNYDNDLLIKENKYKKGRDGYKILYIDKCKIVLDIDYTGILPYTEKIDDDVIKVFYIKNSSDFLWANRAITTKDGIFKNKFSYYQNNIIFIDNNATYNGTTNVIWGANSGVSGTGFYVRDDNKNWVSITADLMSGSYSIVASTSSIDKIKIMNEDFTYGREFKSGYIYKWTTGATQSSWEIDVECFEPYLTKNNFRDGIFKGVWNSGLYGQYSTKINWHGDGSTWNNGTLINTIWKKGQINSLYTTIDSYFANLDSSGTPYQKINSPNNAGRGYNFISDCIMNESDIENGSFYKTIFGSASATFSTVENEILNIESPYINTINKSFFNKCIFNNSHLIGSELKNTLANNSKFEKVKSINSYFNNSVFKNSLYNSDNIVKIWAYDELSASEMGLTSSTYSTINDVCQKIYKFYIDKDGYDRLKIGDTFYIKGLKINNGSKEIITIFDRKFKIGTWCEWTEEKITQKNGYEYAAFLSTPIDNTYKFYSIDDGGSWYTIATQSNPNSNLYSIDIWVSRYDILGSLTGDNIDFNHNSTTNTALTSIIDITNAYIIDSDFNSGLIKESDWNSGPHIESNNDNNITVNTTVGGEYNLSIDSNCHLIATTSYNSSYIESGLANLGDVVFLNSVDFFDGTTASRISDTYKVIGINSNGYTLQEIGSYSLISLSASVGTFSTIGAQNRYGHIKKLKIDKTNIKSGFLRRSYITNSIIQNLDYDYTDKDYDNLTKIKNLVVSDSIFSKTDNILSNATYLNSFFVDNSDVWNSGIIQNSIWNGGTFSNGVIRDSRWVNGHFLNGIFYNSKTFNGIASTASPYYYSENINSYYRMGDIPNNRNSWQDGIFENGEFYKSDWEFGTFSNGRFYHSKWYDGIFNNGVIGSKSVANTDTVFYNGTVSYAIVENASLYASDTSLTASVDQNIYWTNGIFQDGLFGSNYGQTASNSATWYNGTFNGGQFISNGKWKNGTFNGGMFLSGYGYTESDITLQSDFAWENGIFNGGEFGNANGLTNSTWYTGEFNGGIFKGRVWNNGVFTYGEFQGSGVSPIGGTNCGSASAFVDSFTLSYWGKWNDGIFTDTKDKFIKDQKTFTTPVKAEIIEKNLIAKKTAKFKNGLWISGTFSHPSGEMISSVWLDGAFEGGKFNSSSFNPYVKRDGSTASSFNLDDTTCYWENGDFYHSDFYISRWKNGNFLLGTATGMIWEDGVANYMNAYNVFWEDGTWRNGNWHGSSFDYDGTVHDDYTLSILQRGMSWSGTTSCHLWNIFQDYIGQEANIADVDAGTISSATGWVASNSSSIVIIDGIPIDIPDEVD